MSIDVAYVDPGSQGYSPYLHMAVLAAELLGGELIRIGPESPSRSQMISGLLPRSRGTENCLFIAHSPSAMNRVTMIPEWRKRYRYLTAWVFDSFWVDSLSNFVKAVQPFDQVFVAEAEDLATWRKRISAPVEWLPLGADALRMGSSNPHRPVDVLRIGRQPTSWQDDEVTAAACEVASLRFAGRPNGSDDATLNQKIVTAAFARSKFSLSFSNAVSPSGQTHPNREYITGRWTDALAGGAIVAGIPPRCLSVEELLWAGALLDLGTVDRDRGLAILSEATADWTPARAERNHIQALERLDWRLRLEIIAKTFGEPIPPRLQAELIKLRAHVSSWRSSIGISS